MKDKLNFGILGCGAIAETHACAVLSVASAHLVGVADHDFERAESFAKKHGVRAYSDYSEMLADHRIDAICICTPSGFHAQNSLDALNAGKHVVVEKPMALNTADADRMIRAARENGCMLTVICQMRFSDGIRRLKSLVDEKSFGTLGLCDLYMKYWRAPDYYAKSAWRGTVEMDGGGALMNQGIHGVDAMLYVLGDARLISSKVKTLYHGIEVEDTAVATLEFESGALGVIEASTCSYPGFSRRIELCGSGGYAVYREGVVEKLVIGDYVEENPINTANSTAANPTALSFYLHARQIENFINAVFGKEELLIDGEEGRRALALIEKIYEYGR